MHGEAAVMPWRAEVVAEGDEAVEVLLEIDLLLTPLRLQRHMRLERGQRVIAFRERLSNTGGSGVEFVWGHHPALGAPFLSPACRFDVGARELVVDAGYASPFLPLEPGSRVDWAGGVRQMLSELPGPGVRRDMVGYFLGFEQGWWAVTNREHRIGFGLAWDAATFPFACFWHELGATEGFPWFGRGYALALEPVTSLACLGDRRGRTDDRDAAVPRARPGSRDRAVGDRLRGGVGSRANRAGRRRRPQWVDPTRVIDNERLEIVDKSLPAL